MDAKECREAFEAWAKSEDYDLTLNGNGDYFYLIAHEAWKGWNAALASRPRLTDEQIEEMWKSLWGQSYSTEIRRRKFARALLSKATGEGKL